MPNTELRSCLACGSGKLKEVLSLGSQPLANSFHNGSEELPEFPLVMNVCTECFHGQLSLAVDPALLFTNYAYVSGTTRTLRDYFKWFVKKLEDDTEHRALRILEIGCNDGTLLRMLESRWNDVWGVDPAMPDDLPGLKRFWDGDTASIIERHGPFDAIIAMNVLAHVDNPTGFLALAKRVLAPGGRIYVQTSQAKMLLMGEFDTIYHEHVSYFTARSFHALAKRAGLNIAKIAHVPIHGTSYLVEFIKEAAYPALSLVNMYADESRMGYYTSDIYDRFRGLAEHTRDQIHKMIDACEYMGYRFAGYGAAAKGMTFLNYTGVRLEFIVDDNPLKQGKYTPGSNIPVVAPEFMETLGSDKVCWLVLAWNFFDEICERIKTARPNSNDMFLTYFPRMRLIQ
jgi:2-polyprenyl-3-methyl-5-hydroxy-6-metoxy-1,4-benzoquinol methylase